MRTEFSKIRTEKHNKHEALIFRQVVDVKKKLEFYSQMPNLFLVWEWMGCKAYNCISTSSLRGTRNFRKIFLGRRGKNRGYPNFHEAKFSGGLHTFRHNHN